MLIMLIQQKRHQNLKSLGIMDTEDMEDTDITMTIIMVDIMEKVITGIMDITVIMDQDTITAAALDH